MNCLLPRLSQQLSAGVGEKGGLISVILPVAEGEFQRGAHATSDAGPPLPARKTRRCASGGLSFECPCESEPPLRRRAIYPVRQPSLVGASEMATIGLRPPSFFIAKALRGAGL
ncbi:MAG: hypothetical protein HYU36_18985 [Planctomycetes bacterium]|nr:hypothetical protein [Planctomycetota bacterium]